jgi:hypothetical protein
MKHEPLFFRLWLAPVVDFRRVGLHRVKSLTRMLHYGNWSWIKFHCLQLLSPLSLSFTALSAHLLQPPKTILASHPKKQNKAQDQKPSAILHDVQEGQICRKSSIVPMRWRWPPNPFKLFFYFLCIRTYMFSIPTIKYVCTRWVYIKCIRSLLALPARERLGY